jgi:Zn-dependent oligopeptidase
MLLSFRFSLSQFTPLECTSVSHSLSFQLALANQEAKFLSISEPLAFYQNVSPSKELRDASNEAEVAFRDHSVESSMRVDIYTAKLAARKNIKESGRTLSPEEQRLVDKMILDGTRDGLGLPDEERAELMKLQKELSQNCLEFNVSRLRIPEFFDIL